MTIATRPQPDTAVPSRPDPSDAGGSILVDIASGWWWLIWSAVKGVFKLVDWILSGLLWTLTGSARAWFAPLWVLGLGVASTLAPESSWAWIGVACWLHLRPARPEGRLRLKLSARERAIVAKVAAVVGLVVDWHLSLLWSSILLGAVIVVGSVPWLRGRRVRKARTPEMVRRWDEEVVTKHPKLAGEWVDFNEDAGTGVLDLAGAKASEVAGMEEDVEWALNQLGGTVTITDDPRLTRRQVRVAFSRPGDADRFRYWEGRTLQADGRFTALYAKGETPLYGRLWMPDGASFISIVAPPGSGKGSIQRLIGLEAAIEPSIFPIGVDGKRGKGLGYLQGAFGLPLAKTPDQWLKRIDGVIAEMERRSEDGDESDSFVLRPGYPRILLMIDDLPEVLAKCPSVAGKLKRITSQGRSLGIGLCTAKQKGDAPSYGHTTTRANMLENGWMWAGPAIDQQACLAMKQGFPFDPGTLPSAKGWAAVMGGHLGDQAIEPGRTLWIPNRNDVAEFGFEAPVGTVEDWLERDAFLPELAPEVALALGVVEPAKPAPAPAKAAPEGGAITITTLPPKPAPQPAPKPEAPAPKPGSGWARIVAELRKHPAGRTALEISTEVGLTKRHTSQLLSEHPAEAVQGDDYRWRLT